MRKNRKSFDEDISHRFQHFAVRTFPAASNDLKPLLTRCRVAVLTLEVHLDSDALTLDSVSGAERGGVKIGTKLSSSRSGNLMPLDLKLYKKKNITNQFISGLSPCFNQNKGLVPIVGYCLRIIYQFYHLIKHLLCCDLRESFLTVLHACLKEHQCKILDPWILQHNSFLDATNKLYAIDLLTVDHVTDFELMELIPAVTFLPISTPLILRRSPKELTFSIRSSPIVAGKNSCRQQEMEKITPLPHANRYEKEIRRGNGDEEKQRQINYRNSQQI
ncbi:hypothetical protein M5K25_010206 [Dendrobium thyrsiflorum]|uniref:Uncharacterized protein n=1 Tax=Dendrobium thyrsiflorum TaxID=117978 RepID=A0ABD0UZF4_DENTH